MECKLTVDNEIRYVKYNNITLDINGDQSTWTSEKSISFEAVNDDPGTLEIKGFNQENTNCQSGGMLIHCISNDTSSPWHNFVSDDVNWEDENNNVPIYCQNGMMKWGSSHDIIKFFKSVGAKAIWANRQTVTFSGTPKRVEKGIFPWRY